MSLPFAPPTPSAKGLTARLRQRLLVLLLAPLVLLTLLSAWLDSRSADDVAARQDRRLLALVPLLADSLIAEGRRAGEPPVLLMAPPVVEFLAEHPAFSDFALLDADGALLHGDAWLAGLPPTTLEPEFRSEERLGITWRIVRQRQQTVVGDVVVVLADGSDPRQQWARAVFWNVLLPHALLLAAAVFAVNWSVRQALRPLLDLKEAVEQRSPRDLSAIDLLSAPEEVRPLVASLNRLFGLVNAQAESQQRFIADAAHQLRTPLAALQAQVEAWAQSAQTAPTDAPLCLPAEQVRWLRDATRRTSQLAHQLLALSRADARTMQGQSMQRVDLKALCESILQAHLDAATAKHIDLGLDAAPAQATGNEWLLREMLSNLADNAVKYTPEGGTVTLRCGHRAGATFLEVEDDGPGIASHERPRVLERFYRVPGTHGEGNGLGLAIAAEIARLHGSRLQLEPGHDGQGLRVVVELAG